MFYSMNTFHLPVGSAKDAQAWFDNLNMERRDLIKSVGIYLRLEDITPAVFTEMEKKWLWDLPVKTRRLEQRMVFEVAYLLCWRYWQDKIDFLKKWEGLERVVVRWGCGGDKVVFEGENWRELDVKEERRVMDGAREVVKVELEGLVEEVGWMKARLALMNGGAGAGAMV